MFRPLGALLAESGIHDCNMMCYCYSVCVCDCSPTSPGEGLYYKVLTSAALLHHQSQLVPVSVVQENIPWVPVTWELSVVQQHEHTYHKLQKSFHFT